MFNVHMMQTHKVTGVKFIVQTWGGFETKEEAQAFIGGTASPRTSVQVAEIEPGVDGTVVIEQVE